MGQMGGRKMPRCPEASRNRVTVPGSSPGENFVCCVPLEDQAATTNNFGLGTPFAGNLEVYPVYRLGFATAVEESPTPQATSSKPQATILRGALMLEPANRDGRMAKGALLDISGRKVLDLHPGANDVRALTPGVYFVRSLFGGERQPPSVTKVIINR